MQARTAKTSEARNLLEQLQKQAQSLREAQEAELEARRKYQELISTGGPSKEDHLQMERKLDEEITAKKKIAAELEQARNQLTLLQHMGPPHRQTAPGLSTGNWSIVPEYGMHVHPPHGHVPLQGVVRATTSSEDVDTLIREMTKVAHTLWLSIGDAGLESVVQLSLGSGSIGCLRESVTFCAVPEAVRPGGRGEQAFEI